MRGRRALRHGVGAGLLLVTTTACLTGAPRVFLIGDSTMADKPRPTENPERGWGQALREHAARPALLRNHAANGRSTRSFLAEGRWAAVRDSLRRGDVVFIQFGHNDQKIEDSTRYAAAATDFRAHLRRFVIETRERGARPVLFSSIVRRRFTVEGVLEDTHGAYPAATRDVARSLDVPFVDLERLTAALLQRAGPEGSRRYYVHVDAGAFPAFPAARRDDTHLSPEGADSVAALVVAALRRTDRRLAALWR